MNAQTLEVDAVSPFSITPRTASSGVSWGAVLAGAAAAAALSMILLILGVGLGLSAVSPWTYNTAVIGASTLAWLAFTQLAASGLGGYIAGRLRDRWTDLHTHEVYFRDTAHGLLAWAVSSLLTAALLTGVMHSIISAAGDVATDAALVAGATAASGAVTTTAPSKDKAIDYFSDMVLRSDLVALGSPAINSNAARNEVSKILANDLAVGKMPTEDREYLSKIVARRTGLSQADAEKRVDNVYVQLNKAIVDAQTAAKAAADQARKTAAHTALWTFVALLIGAFVASFFATFGGRQRDGAHIA
ncbi:hypothetical protein [Undibacterium sp. TJN19]|uniref:hypothetical protein n=1 Tax=Undibacterium sp. TJN19 TaxID=3413055 RepID=UPI003BF131EC